MSEKSLLERFDLVADYPENIPLLRRYIVDLAVRGKLLPTTEQDISATEILSRIAAKTELLIKQGQLKKSKPLPAISADELPPAYVAHCQFERLGNVANLQKGLTGIQGAVPGEFPLVVTAAARSTCDHYDFDGAAAIIPMVSSTGHGHASLNRLHYQEGKFALGTILCAVFPIDEELLSARFLFEYLAAFKDDLLVSRMNGTANVTLTVNKIAEVPVPLIAPAVQRRIEELMVLCDQLLVSQNEQETKRDRLVAASLSRIKTVPSATSENASEIARLGTAARFHLDHLPSLATRPEHIEQLRQAILNLAIRGHLVAQDPNDEPAAKLLERIAAQRHQLLKSGYPNDDEARSQLKKQAAQTVPKGLESIPSGWQWTTLMQCSALVIDCHNKTAPYSPTGIPLVRTTNVRNGKLTMNALRFVDEPTYKRWSARCQPESGDLLITREAPMGEVALVPADMKICLGQRMMLARLMPKTIDPQFMLYSLRDPMLMTRVQDKPVGATVQHLRVGGVETLLVPVPPLAEQRRIAAKVDELMSLCDQLATQLTTTETDSRRLLEAVLRDALASDAVAA